MRQVIGGRRQGSTPRVDRGRDALAPPRGALRAVLRAPRLLYRLHAGRLLGRTHLLLRHRGRVTGQVHEAVLEAMAVDPHTGERIVASYWGPASNWWRNVAAGGAVEVVTPGARYTPEVRVLDGAERIDVLRRYRTERPLWARLGAVAFGLPVGTDHAVLAEVADRLPMVGLAPARTRSGEGDRSSGRG